MAKLAIGKTKREKMLLAILVIAGIIAAYFHVFVRPAIMELGKLLPEVASMRRDLAEAKTLISNKDVIMRQKEKLALRLEEYEKMLPREREIPRLLENLSGIAGQSGVKIVGIKPIGSKEYEPKEKLEIYQEIPIEIIALSGYHELGRFLEKLETGDRFIKIDDLEIIASKDDIKRHNVRLIASTYVLTEK